MFGLHSGIEGNFRHDAGILPLYINRRITLDVGDDSKLILAFAYGKNFQIGAENFKGSLNKYTIGFTTITDGDIMQTFFIEVTNHGFYYPDGVKAITLNLGYTFKFL
ncbi:hypothetical protein [Flavobacterium sp. 25HG05S-40]|uniref:hypothetical protein n=1 Tax=Flavobacterium sp. 25HG05S-40 TaxID=3458682 RepID=UPI0040448739